MINLLRNDLLSQSQPPIESLNPSLYFSPFNSGDFCNQGVCSNATMSLRIATFGYSIQLSHFLYESLRLNRLNGIAKVLGVLASAGGASIITLYKGPTIYAPESPLAVHQGQFLSLFEDFNGKNMNLGGIFLFGHCLSWSGWILMHAFVLKKIPAQLTVSAFTCLFGIVQFGTIATFLEKDPKAWQLNSFEEAYCILYSGVVISGVAAAIQIWTIRKGGPVLASIYLPLQTLLVAFSNIFQGHVNHLLKLDGAKDRLQLFKADLVEECSFDSIIHDCHGSFILFHWLVLLLTTLM
ncbi:protein WALLS ARE THIN 1-like [Vicia villosa]|uniref:protein WALLS ARE THIN 1-like n=1 Tax=Vicia villosa TaxID=3911 RepID=UPI00273B158B|nr:protein WALLS ARE THIN 1-like [Vicia villosa]